MKNPLQTQQTRARKEFKALHRAEENGVTDAEIIQEIAKKHENPGSDEAVIAAATTVIYMRNVKEGATPITDAVNTCLERKRQAKASTRSAAGAIPNPA